MDPLINEFFDFQNASTDYIPSSPAFNSSPDGLTCPSTSPDDLVVLMEHVDIIPDVDFVVDINADVESHHLPPEIWETFGFKEEEPGAKLDYDNYAQWVPCFSKPKEACAYCRARHLECWFTYEGQEDCSACKALFRPCSFTVEQHPDVLMDTLHTISEDHIITEGGMTGSKALRSWDRTPLDHPQAKKSSTRFSRENLSILKKWVNQHKAHPYPTEVEKEELVLLTGLTIGQISNWFANTRRRSRQQTRAASPSVQNPVSDAIPIPQNRQGLVFEGKTWEGMNPMDRWRASPPEHDPADVDDIANAVVNTHVSTPSISRKSSNGNVFSSAPSVASLETGRSDSQLSSGSFSNHSLTSSHSINSRGSGISSSGLRKDRKRRRRTATTFSTQNSHNQQSSKARPFQCTFCTDVFRTKHDWSRHEKSLHLTLEKWICSPLGPVINCPNTGLKTCVFCGQDSPTKEHLEGHNHDVCDEKLPSERTFFRKDHLRQHLKLVHGCKMIDSMESWKAEAVLIRSRCGFCDEKFTSWAERADHLAKHFRAGAKMKDWKGCRGLDEDVAQHVTNAMPPFMIGIEALSMNPFSAASRNMMQAFPPEPFHQNDITPLQDPSLYYALSGGSPNLSSLGIDQPKVSSCWQVLTLTLGNWVQEQIRQGLPVSDEMLQQAARFALYGSDDQWNQTAADNPEWLELFKKAHGLPSTSPDDHVSMIEDLGVNHGELNFDSLLADSSWDALM